MQDAFLNNQKGIIKVATNLIDLKNNVLFPTTSMLSPIAVATGTTNTTAVMDCNSAVFPINVVQSTGVFTSPGTLITTLQEAIEDPASPGNPLSTDWSTITSQTNFPTTFTTVSASNKKQILVVQQMTKRFLRASLVVAGGGASVIVNMEMYTQAKITGTGQGYSTSPQT